MAFGGGNVLELARDPVTPKADRDAFEAAMKVAAAKWQMVVFSGVLHAYTDQGADVPGIAAWDEPATRQTYVFTHQFLADAFASRSVSCRPGVEFPSQPVTQAG
jgi:dienelactone hydrolase